MIRYVLLALLATVVLAGCTPALVERLAGEDSSSPPVNEQRETPDTFQPRQSLTNVDVSINGYRLTASDLAHVESAYGLRIDSGDYWYDPISGAWGYWGGPTAGFIIPYLDLGYAPVNASGGGTGVVLNGRELHPTDLAGLRQLLGPVYPGYYWLDASGYYGYEGGPAIGNLIYVAQGAGGGGGYHGSTYFGNIGSDGQTSYFYDSSTGCSVMSDGGLSC